MACRHIVLSTVHIVDNVFRFRFPNWRPVDEIGEGVDTVWRYQRYLLMLSVIFCHSAHTGSSVLSLI